MDDKMIAQVDPIRCTVAVIDGLGNRGLSMRRGVPLRAIRYPDIAGP